MISFGEEKYTLTLSPALAWIFAYHVPSVRRFLLPENCLAYISPAVLQPWDFNKQLSNPSELVHRKIFWPSMLDLFVWLELNKLNVISDKDRDDGKDYITLMNENLDTLKQELYQ